MAEGEAGVVGLREGLGEIGRLSPIMLGLLGSSKLEGWRLLCAGRGLSQPRTLSLGMDLPSASSSSIESYKLFIKDCYSRLSYRLIIVLVHTTYLDP